MLYILLLYTSLIQFHLAHGHFERHPAFHVVLIQLLHIFAALDPSPDGTAFANLEVIGISGIPSPADARYVIRFTVRTVYRQQEIRNLPPQRGFAVNRLLADIDVYKRQILNSLLLLRFLLVGIEQIQILELVAGRYEDVYKRQTQGTCMLAIT